MQNKPEKVAIGEALPLEASRPASRARLYNHRPIMHQPNFSTIGIG